MSITALEQVLQTEIAAAHQACELNGPTSGKCAAAWDVVEELQAEISHRRVKEPTNLDSYCNEHPEADECRVYDV